MSFLHQLLAGGVLCWFWFLATWSFYDLVRPPPRWVNNYNFTLISCGPFAIFLFVMMWRAMG